MKLEIFATGSKGNCIVLTDNKGRMLMLDCGIPIQAVYRAVGFNPTALDACLVSHHHAGYVILLADLHQAFLEVAPRERIQGTKGFIQQQYLGLQR